MHHQGRTKVFRVLSLARIPPASLLLPWRWDISSGLPKKSANGGCPEKGKELGMGLEYQEQLWEMGGTVWRKGGIFSPFLGEPSHSDQLPNRRVKPGQEERKWPQVAPQEV